MKCPGALRTVSHSMKPPARSSTPGRPQLSVSALWLALPLAVYLLLPTRNYYWDGVSFAIDAEKPLPLRELLHPNHLLYTAAISWLYHAALRIGVQTRALFLMQFVNSLLAGASVVAVYRALRRRLVSMQAGMAGALAFGFAATWWRFATDADAYIVSIFLVLCANDLLETRRNPVLAGVAHAGAMLFHQLAFLFLPVALFRLKEPRKALAYAGSSLAPAGIAYVLAYRTVFGRFDAAGLLRWVTAHSPDAAFSYRPIRDLGLTLLGTLRLFFGGKLDQAKAEPLTIVGFTAIAVCVAALAFRWSRGGPRRFAAPPKDLLLWLAAYVAFLFFWMPQNTFYRLFYLAPSILIVCCAVRGLRVDRLLPPLVCGVLFLWNLVFLIYPQSRVQNNVPLQFALAQHGRWPPGTPIAFHRFHSDLWTISYFNQQASWIGLNELDLRLLESSLADARQRGQSLWLEATAYEFISADPGGRRWLASHGVAELLHFRDPKHEFRFYELR